MKKIEEFEEIIENTITLERLQFHIEQLRQGEVILAENPEAEKVERRLAELYVTMNMMVEAARVFLQYPKDRRKWNDSEPISILGRVVPEVMDTEWYQTQLTSLIMF